MPKPTPSPIFLQPEAFTKMGCALMGSGEGAKAAMLVKAGLSQGDDPALESAARVILSHRVPQWHGPMLADAVRNMAFEQAIKQALPAGGIVLDIGAGSGLLSLMAARAGASAVYACEANPVLAATAQEIVARNGYSQTIQVLAKRSTDLDREIDLGGGADVIIAEIFSDDLIGEGALASFEHAAAALARKGARIVPAAASIQVALAWLEREPASLDDVQGFDLSPFERHVAPDIKVSVNHPKLSLRSEAKSLFRFDFQSGGPFPAGRAQVTLSAGSGAANGVVRWIKLELDGESEYENRPGSGGRSHWAALFWPFPGDLEAGESIELHAVHDRERVTLWTA